MPRRHGGNMTDRTLQMTRAGLALAAGLSMAATQAAAQRTNRIAVSSTYPMAVMAGVLETRYGWIVTYEDAPLVNERDVVDKASESRRSAGKRSLSARPQEIDLPGGLPDIENGRDREVFERVFAAHEGRDNAGRFAVVERAPGFFHIVPRQFRDANGVWRSTRSPLEAAIAFPTEERSADDTLQIILTSVSQATGMRVWGGTVTASNAFLNTRVTIGANQEPARDVLYRVITAVRARRTWRLAYSPFDNSYALSVHGPGVDLGTGSVTDASGLGR